ncbi:sodium- and chloride-dependent glycine transporter 2-like [Haliotis rubra]|uniref:sodium- and chloride-dependent glycine transporter 2-like n=1 Tax=Haliotis rubra TaxID=36100 RepID=UPI001EE4FFD5|nr:sodium- and chloride-dependent glycine transporter 2-like [Haliotis rubra]
MADITNQDIENVVDQGPGLAFIAYPESIAKLPVSSLWAFLFFFMLFSLGMDTQFTAMQTIVGGISDVFPRFLRPHKTAFTALCCLLGFLLGLPFVTKGGIYVLTLTDWYCGSYSVMLVCLAEIICIMYVYGVKRFMEDIKMMLGRRPNPYWVINWVFLTPAALLFLLIVSASQYTPAFYGDYKFPLWAEGIGWCMVVAPVITVILIFVVQIFRLGPRKAFVPTPSWGPAGQENRTGRYWASAEVPDGHALDSISANTEDKPPAKCGSDNHGFYSSKM